MKLVVSDHLETTTPWKGPLLEPGELIQYGGVPAAKNLAKMAGNRFELSVVQKNRNDITKSLEKYVPVRYVAGSEIHILSNGAPVWAALPLSWDDYCGVANSEFMIKCHMDGGLVEIDSDGLGSAFKDPGSNCIQGIVVEYKKSREDRIEQHLSDLGKLAPYAIHLQNLHDWEAEGCSQTDGAPDRVP